MHPLEQLRYVARNWESGDEFPAQEVAAVLADLAAQSPVTLVHSCRRLIEYFPSSGPAWWLSARVLAGGGVVDAIWEAADELAADPTGGLLGGALVPAGVGTVAAPQPSGLVSVALRDLDGIRVEKKVANADLVVVAARAAGPSAVLAGARAIAMAAAARGTGKPVWVVVERGVLLPGPLWEQLLARVGAPGPLAVLPLGDVSAGVGERGLGALSEVLAAPTCSPVAELLGWKG